MSRLTKPRTQTPRGIAGRGLNRSSGGAMALERPAHMLAHERRWMIRARAQRRDDARRGRRVAQGDRDVAQPPLMADAADGRAFEALIEFALGPREEAHEHRVVEVVAHREVGIVRGLRVLVPRTDDLAVVASIDAVAHERTQLFGDRPEVLDREIGDAAARVELVRSDDRARGADVDAALARAAVR